MPFRNERNGISLFVVFCFFSAILTKKESAKLLKIY